MPRLHPDHYKRYTDAYRAEDRMQTAAEAIDLSGVNDALNTDPRITRMRDAGLWLESVAFQTYDEFSQRYRLAKPNAPAKLDKDHFNYLSSRPNETHFQRESLHIIDRLVHKGVDPLRRYSFDKDAPKSEWLCAAEYMFVVNTESENRHSKSQVVLHALNANPSFRPRFQTMMRMQDKDFEGAEAEYQRMDLANHLNELGMHISTRLVAPTTALEKQVAGRMKREDRLFWLYPSHNWDLNALPPEKPSASSVRPRSVRRAYGPHR